MKTGQWEKLEEGEVDQYCKTMFRIMGDEEKHYLESRSC